MKTKIKKTACAASVSLALIALEGSAWAASHDAAPTESDTGSIIEVTVSTSGEGTESNAVGVRAGSGTTVEVGSSGASVSVSADASGDGSNAAAVHTLSGGETRITADTLTLTANSAAGQAAGIYNNGGTVSIDIGSLTSGTTGADWAVGLYNDGTISISADKSVSFSMDQASESDSFCAAGIYIAGNVSVTAESLSIETASVDNMGGCGILNNGEMTVTVDSLDIDIASSEGSSGIQNTSSGNLSISATGDVTTVTKATADAATYDPAGIYNTGTVSITAKGLTIRTTSENMVACGICNEAGAEAALSATSLVIAANGATRALGIDNRGTLSISASGSVTVTADSAASSDDYVDGIANSGAASITADSLKVEESSDESYATGFFNNGEA